MQRRGLKLLKFVGVELAWIAGVWLAILCLWLLSGARYSFTGRTAEGGTWMACGSVFESPNWFSYLLIHHFALPLGILAAAIGLIRYCSLKSTSIPNSYMD